MVWNEVLMSKLFDCLVLRCESLMLADASVDARNGVLKNTHRGLNEYLYEKLTICLS